MSLLVFLDRSRRAERYPLLEWKVRFFAVGAALAIGGMVLGIDWLVTAAIFILVAGFFLRFFPGGTGEEDDQAS
jgi:hypothetical protein